MTPVVLLLLAAALVVVCGIFVAAEFAFITVNRASVEAAASDRQARCQPRSRSTRWSTCR